MIYRKKTFNIIILVLDSRYFNYKVIEGQDLFPKITFWVGFFRTIFQSFFLSFSFYLILVYCWPVFTIDFISVNKFWYFFLGAIENSLWDIYKSDIHIFFPVMIEEGHG